MDETPELRFSPGTNTNWLQCLETLRKSQPVKQNVKHCFTDDIAGLTNFQTALQVPGMRFGELVCGEGPRMLRGLCRGLIQGPIVNQSQSRIYRLLGERKQELGLLKQNDGSVGG